MRIQELMEAVRKAPTNKNEYKLLRELFEQPIPAATARETLCGVIDDDWLNDRIDEVALRDPNQDVRDIVRDWVELNMPDLARSAKQDKTMQNTNGIYSVLHGYHVDDYTGPGKFRQ